MKRQLLAILCLLLTLNGCGTKHKDSDNDQYENGPVTEVDTRTDEEKELQMIQGCINDYNINRIPEIEEYLNTQIHPLPLEVTSLPEISSLKDLTKEEEYTTNTNCSYAGSYMIDDKYKVIFLIYEPTGNSFWLNGRILFQIDPSLVTVDDSRFTDYRNAMTTLLTREKNILNWLYGLNLVLSEEEVIPGYYEVLAMGERMPSSIDEIKQIAEEVFTKEYLEENFYYSAFYSESAMFKEVNGKVVCARSEMIEQESSSIYNPHYIIAAEERDGIVYLDMLSDFLNEVQPDIKRLTLAITENGYRLPAAY
ncbi:MAG: hypothetical protein IKF60_06560 [Solobacterium sp.]|nr:hypothetical protein [Solobacterium sp.]